MRIGDFNAAAVNPASGQAAEKPLEEAGRPLNATPDDAVALSRLSQAIAELGPSEARLELLRREVEAGTYRIPAEEIATKIVDLHGE
ncbi:MAG: flagellar biosynthesis anti-sigma factor FlgM [Bryobacteraceae bacterium]|jgi:anti-sigma28 factor (negative regulator of flagellin synthesis)